MLKFSDNASDIVVVSDVKRDVISPIRYHKQKCAHTHTMHTYTQSKMPCPFNFFTLYSGQFEGLLTRYKYQYCPVMTKTYLSLAKTKSL